MAQIFPNDDHDTVVRKYAELVGKNNPDKFKVSTKLTSDKPVEIDGQVPDIVLQDASGSEILIAIEVETVSSISLEQAQECWKPVADAVPVFQILTPKGTTARVNRLCKKLGIKARLQEY